MKGLQTSGTTLPLLLLVIAAVAFTACQGGKAGTPSLPPELAATQVPSVPMDAYLFVCQAQDTRIEGRLLSLQEDVVVRFAQAWLVPSDGKEVLGGRIQFSSPQEAQRTSDAIGSADPKLWKRVSGSSLFLVYGEGGGAKSLTSAIEGNQFSSVETNAPDGWAMIQQLPSSPPGKTVATGFVKLSDSLLAYLKENVQAETWNQVEPIISQARIDGVAVAGYLEKTINPSEINSVADVKEHKAAVMITGKSGLPGFLFPMAMKVVGPRVGLTEESITNGSALSKTMEIEGTPMYFLLGASGSQIYLTAALDFSLSKKLLESVLAP